MIRKLIRKIFGRAKKITNTDLKGNVLTLDHVTDGFYVYKDYGQFSLERLEKLYEAEMAFSYGLTKDYLMELFDSCLNNFNKGEFHKVVANISEAKLRLIACDQYDALLNVCSIFFIHEDELLNKANNIIIYDEEQTQKKKRYLKKNQKCFKNLGMLYLQSARNSNSEESQSIINYSLMIQTQLQALQKQIMGMPIQEVEMEKLKKDLEKIDLNFGKTPTSQNN